MSDKPTNDEARGALLRAVADTLALETWGYRVEVHPEYDEGQFTLHHVKSGKVFAVSVEEL